MTFETFDQSDDMCISETVFLVPDCDPKYTNTQIQDMTKCHFDSKAKSALFLALVYNCRWWSQGYMYYVCSIPGDRFECSKQSVAASDSLWQSVTFCGTLWHSLAVFGSLWQSVVVYSSLWQSLAACVSL